MNEYDEVLDVEDLTAADKNGTKDMRRPIKKIDDKYKKKNKGSTPK